MDVVDGLGQKSGHGKYLDFRTFFILVAQGDGVGHQHLGKIGSAQALDGRTGKHRVGGAGHNFLGPVLQQHLACGDHGAGGVDHVVNDDSHLVLDVADNVHGRSLVGTVAALVDDGQPGPQAFGVRAGAFDAPGVGRYQNHFRGHVPDVVQNDRLRVQVVHGQIEKALDLAGVQIHGHQAVHAGRRQKVGHHFGADGRARADLPVLAGVAVIGNDSGNAAGAGPFQGVQHQAELHEVEVDRSAGGLNDKNVVAPDIVAYFNANFPVAECLAHRRRNPATEVVANGGGKLRVGTACQNFKIARHDEPDRFMCMGLQTKSRRNGIRGGGFCGNFGRGGRTRTLE